MQMDALTVREVKVKHMPPKPLKVRAMKMRTESSTNDKGHGNMSLRGFKYGQNNV